MFTIPASLFFFIIIIIQAFFPEPEVPMGSGNISQTMEIPVSNQLQS